MDKIFSRTRSTRDIMVSAGLVIAGIAIVAVPSAVSVNILGAFLCFVGLVTFFMLKSARVDKETGIKYKRIVKYFPSEKKDDITSISKFSSPYFRIALCKFVSEPKRAFLLCLLNLVFTLSEVIPT